ncbi:MAG: hypothetical protein AB1416_00815 [Actinomycetota bacterium]
MIDLVAGRRCASTVEAILAVSDFRERTGVATLGVGSGRPLYLVTVKQHVHERLRADWRSDRPVDAWTVQRAARLGDPFLVYVAQPVGAIAWIGRLRSDTAPLDGRRQSAAWVEVHPLEMPVEWERLNSDGSFGAWTALRGRLQGYSRGVPEPFSGALLDLVRDSNPAAEKLLRRWAARPPQPEEDSLEDLEWGLDAGDVFPFVRERQLQVGLADLLVRRLPLRAPREEDGLGSLRADEPHFGEAGRGDILLVHKSRKKTIYLVECKLHARSVVGVEQLVRYRDWLMERFGDWEIVPVLCALSFSREAREAATRAGVDRWLAAWGRDGESVRVDVDASDGAW